jgi:hypothetical protein
MASFSRISEACRFLLRQCRSERRLIYSACFQQFHSMLKNGVAFSGSVEIHATELSSRVMTDASVRSRS